MRLSSGPPWHLECHVERIGDDYLCRIGGGARHIGAVALSQWRVNRASTESLSVAGHKEQCIVERVAETLCTASRRSVTCVAGIHFDSLDRRQIEEIVQAAYALGHQAAARLERQAENRPKQS
jgi:hypothetical protein